MSIENIIKQYNEMWVDPRYEFFIYLENQRFFTYRIRRNRNYSRKDELRASCKETNKHHRLSRALGGTNSFPKNNLIIVSKYRHSLWTEIFPGEYTLTLIAIKTEEILDRLGVTATVGFHQK